MFGDVILFCALVQVSSPDADVGFWRFPPAYWLNGAMRAKEGRWVLEFLFPHKTLVTKKKTSQHPQEKAMQSGLWFLTMFVDS